jgi:hypothetical protein
MVTNYTSAWSATDPTSNSALSAGATAIRTLKDDVADRMKTEHIWNAEQDSELSTADGRHLPGQVAVVGLRTQAQAVAATKIATFPAQGHFATGSDHSGMWYWDSTNSVWIRSGIHTLLYRTLTTNAFTLSTTLTAIYLSTTTTTIDVSLIKGESVIIESCVSAHASAVDSDENRYVDFIGFRSDGYYLLSSGSTVLVAADLSTEHERILFNPDGDGNLATSTLIFYDHEPVTGVAYATKTYSIKAKVSGSTTAVLRSALTKVSVIRTSALA